jgi:hypothetical protein
MNKSRYSIAQDDSMKIQDLIHINSPEERKTLLEEISFRSLHTELESGTSIKNNHYQVDKICDLVVEKLNAVPKVKTKLSVIKNNFGLFGKKQEPSINNVNLKRMQNSVRSIKSGYNNYSSQKLDEALEIDEQVELQIRKSDIRMLGSAITNNTNVHFAEKRSLLEQDSQKMIEEGLDAFGNIIDQDLEPLSVAESFLSRRMGIHLN